VYKTRLSSRAHLESFLRQKPDIGAEREGETVDLAKIVKIKWRVKVGKLLQQRLYKLIHTFFNFKQEWNGAFELSVEQHKLSKCFLCSYVYSIDTTIHLLRTEIHY
jgi:hypothetical protein